MSAIVGIFRRDGAPVATEMLAPAMDAVAQYGADAGGVWCSGSVGFGHRMGRLTLESAREPQPFARGHLTIAADARIDNRSELFDALDVPAAERRAMPDSEIVLRAFERWSDHCPEHLVGDYAFAIWDARRQSLFCARDHIGARPFYYFLTAELFAFASDIRAVHALPGVRARIDETEIAKCLLSPSSTYFDNARTFFKNLHKLPFAHRLTINRDRVRSDPYWKPEALDEVRLPAITDYSDRLSGLLEQAVADRLRTNATVGAHLSGGLDSSSVAVLAARLQRTRGAPAPVAFSWSPPRLHRAEGTEHQRIEAVCRQERLQVVYAAPPGASDATLPNDDISIRPLTNMRVEYRVQRQAAARGVRLMLSGWGGDEGISFNGRGLAAQYLSQRRWRNLADHLRMSEPLRHPRRFLRGARQFWRQAIVPNLSDAVFDLVAHPDGRRMRGEPLIDPKFAARVLPHSPPRRHRTREVADARAVQCALYHAGHITNRMESWTAFGADHGLVYAHPLTDRRLLEFAYAIPADLCHQQGHDRFLYRHTVSRLLPQGVAWARVKTDAALQALVERGIVAGSERLRMNEHLCVPNPWVPVAQLRRALMREPAGVRGQRFATRHALECLAIWNRWQTAV